MEHPPKQQKPRPENDPVRAKLFAPLIIGEVYMVAAETQTTVGAAGGATALPATPTGYLKMVLNDTEYVLPFYAVS